MTDYDDPFNVRPSMTEEDEERGRARIRERLAALVPNPRPESDSRAEIVTQAAQWLAPWLDRTYGLGDMVKPGSTDPDDFLRIVQAVITGPRREPDPVADGVVGEIANMSGYLRVARLETCPETRRYKVAAAAHALTQAREMRFGRIPPPPGRPARSA